MLCFGMRVKTNSSTFAISIASGATLNMQSNSLPTSPYTRVSVKGQFSGVLDNVRLQKDLDCRFELGFQEFADGYDAPDFRPNVESTTTVRQSFEPHAMGFSCSISKMGVTRNFTRRRASLRLSFRSIFFLPDEKADALPLR